MAAEEIKVDQSIQEAINYSPYLKALSHNRQASESDLKQSFNRYYPSVDLMVGYGLEQHSDVSTRRAGADPSNSDFDPLTDVSLTLTQVLWDGGEISRNVSVKKALLETADFQVEHARQLISINAVAAHLEVYRQRELAALAKKKFFVPRRNFRLAFRNGKGGGRQYCRCNPSQSQDGQGRI
ncbi:TolC family protein [Desulfobacter curvatus]|uniref:TolC family protein n=1 Tax=Desulfobacter curvatus TaxID=2290 RepID=UPI0012FCA31B|nr:TolC family protein [Desulfobacter curvatus]